MRHFLSVVVFVSNFGYSQTILNSESLLNHSADKLTTQLNLSVDWESGNENTFATFNQILVGTKKGKQLWRLIIGHDSEDDEGEIVANDWSGQLRLNHYVNDKNSIYGFVQSQNNLVLQMNHRHLFGGGYRHSLYANESQYFDLAAGLFYEDEEYPELQSDKLRFNINGFVRMKIFEKLFFNCVSYFQINTKDTSDIRLFVEPKINFELDKFTLSIVGQNRYNSVPYLLNKKNDFLSQLVLTINPFD
jgi:hypothetical protein